MTSLHRPFHLTALLSPGYSQQTQLPSAHASLRAWPEADGSKPEHRALPKSHILRLP